MLRDLKHQLSWCIFGPDVPRGWQGYIHGEVPVTRFIAHKLACRLRYQGSSASACSITNQYNVGFF